MALLTKVKATMAIHAHRKVRGLLDGEYQSVHTGRSMDFFDLREYVLGDDVKDLDWKASARRGDLLVKRFVADRRHTILLCVSASCSMAALGTDGRPKRDTVILAAGILGWLATRHHDWVGLVQGNAAGCRLHRPATSEVALERMLGALSEACTADAPEPDLAALLAHTVRTVRRRTILVVIADDTDLDDRSHAELRRLRAQHEVLYLTIADLDPTDPTARAVPAERARQSGEAEPAEELVDLASRTVWPDFLSADPLLQAEATAARAARVARRERVLDRLGIASEHITGDADVVPSIFRLLERHRHAR